MRKGSRGTLHRPELPQSQPAVCDLQHTLWRSSIVQEPLVLVRQELGLSERAEVHRLGHALGGLRGPLGEVDRSGIGRGDCGEQGLGRDDEVPGDVGRKSGKARRVGRDGDERQAAPPSRVSLGICA